MRILNLMNIVTFIIGVGKIAIVGVEVFVQSDTVLASHLFACLFQSSHHQYLAVSYLVVNLTDTYCILYDY